MRECVIWLAVVAGATGCRQILGLDDTSVGGGDAMTSDAVTIDASPACIDGELSPGETDVDCGGVCPRKCEAGDDCAMHSDCASRVCDGMNTCAVLTSCLAIRDAGQTASGVYPLDVDGPGSQPPFDAYCDQAAAGGGWTLVMKLSSTDDELAFDAPYWETAALLAPTDLAPNTAPQGSNAKLEAFNLVTGTGLRLEWRDPADHAFTYTMPPGTTALAVFAGGEVMVDGSETNACHGDLLTGAPGYLGTHMRHGEAAQFFGINGSDGTERIRFGFASNDEPANAWFPYQGVGTTTQSAQWTSHTDCNNCPCYGTSYQTAVTSANLWIR